MMTALRAVIGVCVLGLSTTLHAATPLTLPLGSEFALLTDGGAIDLPIPPPPRVARPDVSQMRLVIKPQPTKGCEDEGPRMRGVSAERVVGSAQRRARA